MRQQLNGKIGKVESVLRRYAIFRLLRPFFREELYGRKDSEVDAAIRALACRHFESARPLYRVSGDEIEIHPGWCAYLEENAPVVGDWFMWHWSNYLLSRNPNVPSVSRKTGPATRVSLQEQRRYWVDVIGSGSLRCIYSQQPLSSDAFDLDHYLQWSFVAHDQIWNLIPVSREANHAKSDRVPDARYLSDLAHLQVRALERTRRDNPRRWRNVADQFRCDLRVTDEQALLSESELAKAYVDTVGPLTKLAATMGFEVGWQYAGGRGGSTPSNHS